MPYEKVGKVVRCIADEIPFEIPDSWVWARVENILLTEMGQSPAGGSVSNARNGIEFHQGKVFFGDKYLQQSNQTTTSPTKIVESNTILLCVRAPVGKVNITPRKICIGRGLCGINSILGIDTDFLYNLFVYLERIFIKKATGTTFVAITGETVKKQLIPLPPFSEQQRIVKKIKELLPHLDEYGQAETRVKKLNTEFPEHLKKSILQWAIQGKLVPQDPNDEPADVLLERIRAEKAKLIKAGKLKKDKDESFIFRRDNSHYVIQGKKEVCIDEKIPFELPAGWAYCNLSMLTKSIQYGYTASASAKGNAKLLRITDIQDNTVLWKNVPFCSISDEDMKNYRLHNRDIMIARTGGTIGKTYIVRNLNETAVFASYLIRAIPVDQINEEYLKLFMESPLYWNQLKSFSAGTGQPNVNGQALRSLVIPLPPLREQERIVEFYFSLNPTMNSLTEFSL